MTISLFYMQAERKMLPAQKAAMVCGTIITVVRDESVYATLQDPTGNPYVWMTLSALDWQ